MDKDIQIQFDAINQRFDELLEFLQAHVATKDDLKGFATKDDLKGFATKDDLQRLEKKMDEDFATKDDLKRLENKMDEGFASIHGLLRGMQQELDDIKIQLARLEKAVIEDIDVYGKDILDLRQRVEHLEKQLKQLQPA